MSRRRRNGDGPGRERLARRAVGCYLAGAVASVILGVGVALLFDTLRSSTIMPIDDEPAAIFWVPGTLVVGIAGAFLDPTNPEPLPADHPLWQAPNALITMHLSGRSQTKMFQRATALFLDNLAAYASGRPMRNVVDLALGY